jgi:serine O-acetyltransferase
MLDAIALQRAAHALHRRGFCRSARLVTRVLRHLHGCVLPPELELGPGVELGYNGLGVVVHARARIGREVLISPGVVIGGRCGTSGVPVIGDRVKIGAGAKILGPIHIGPDVSVGANAVVLDDVAAGQVVVGMPARPLAGARRRHAVR